MQELVFLFTNLLSGICLTIGFGVQTEIRLLNII